MPPGSGTAVNVVAVLLGTGLGVLLGHRLPERTRDTVTDGLGLVTLLIAAGSAVSAFDPGLAAYVGSSAPLLVVLGAVLLGGIAGSLLRLEERLEGLGELVRRRLSPAARGGTGGGDDADDGGRFVEGFVVASLVFCTGPLTVLGSLYDGLGRGAEELYLKSALDFFAAVAFASAFGWGVAASVVTVLGVQGALTLVGLAVGDVLPDPHVAALAATGGVLLVGVALRLLRLRQVPVVDLLPALVLAPLIVQAVGVVR